jgi:hypothetical protein
MCSIQYAVFDFYLTLLYSWSESAGVCHFVSYVWFKFLLLAVELGGFVCADRHSDCKHLTVAMNMENKSLLLKSVKIQNTDFKIQKCFWCQLYF